MLTDFLQRLGGYGITDWSLNRQKEFLNKSEALDKEYYDKQMKQATNLFNRNYYRNYLDTPTAQHLLKQLREQLGEQTRSMRNTATAMGLTGQSMAAIQKNNNATIDGVVGRLATADVQEKERALQTYDNVRSKLDAFLFDRSKDYMTKRFELKEQRINNLLGLITPTLDSLVKKIGQKQLF